MNNLFLEHKDRLTAYVIVFGMAGLLFFTAMVIASLMLKHGQQVASILKGIGL